MPLSQGEWPPESCDLPDLSGLNAKTSLGLALNRMFCGGGPKEPKSYALLMNFIRVVDKLVVEYEEMRRALDKYVNTPNHIISPFLYATNYGESCITSLVRAINLGRRIRSDAQGPPVARQIVVLHDSVYRRVYEMRCAIEHIDDQIARNTWSVGEPLCVLLKNDRLELYGKEIMYDEISSWIKQLNELSVQLSQYKES